MLKVGSSYEFFNILFFQTYFRNFPRIIFVSECKSGHGKECGGEEAERARLWNEPADGEDLHSTGRVDRAVAFPPNAQGIRCHSILGTLFEILTLLFVFKLFCP